jgi:hypothetical protein
MLSSTSSSETAAPLKRRAAITMAGLLVLLAVALIGFELFARVIVERGSKVQRMVNTEYLDAIRLRHAAPGQPKQLLIVGNSLVGHGIDLDEVKKDLPANWQVHRFWIYNTSYEDWYFGLRRLFADGSRPDAIAVVFAAMHWYAPGIRGDYSAQYLFQASDLRDVQSHLDLSGTAASGLLFAHYSKFFALRGEIRKVLLERAIPDLPQMNALFKPGTPRQFSEADVVHFVTPRMKVFRDLAAQYGVRLIFIVPPIRDADQEHHSGIQHAAQQAGVPVLIPLSARNLKPSDFEDDVHLTPAAATGFTSVLMQQLDPLLNR